LPEQQEIVNVLSSIDENISLINKKICKLDFLLKGLTIKLTSKDAKNDKHSESTIGEEVHFQGGSQPPRSTFKFKPAQNLVRLLQIRDYKSDKKATFIPKELSKRWCSETDVMIGRYGPPNFQILRGKEGSYNVALIKATPKSDKRLNNEYLYRFLSRHDLFEIIDKLSQRTSGQQGVDMNALKSFPFTMKPLKDQTKIVQILQELEDYKNKLVAKKGKYIFFKNALSNDLLSGHKRVGI
jgi:Restriction endonuclease S subunits